MNNPPAFPHSHLGINHGQLSYEDSSYEDGMTLRDYFAAAALQSILQCWTAHKNDWAGIEHLPATAAYAIADAMLKTREQ